MYKEWDAETAHLTPGAGIVLIRKFKNEWKVLGLLLNGQYDITKGHVEKGDSYLDTAIRETYEEADIKELNFVFGYDYCTLDYLRVYMATTTQQAKIKENKNGFKEHESYSWLSFEEMEEQTYDYLKPAIIWAREKIKTREKNDQIGR
tara:strand:- start:2327 stop:2770 length:444 start_codon:yes stop_codon:yes gene_type:complete